MIVAVFWPHTVGMFIGTPPSAFYNQEISGYDIESRQLNDVAARIFDCPSGESVGILERWLLTKVSPTLNMRRIGSSIGELMRMPSVSVNVLAGNACLSRKQYEQVFREQVGMNPKEYARVVRFQKAMRMLQCGSRDYPYIAHHCGYADQSHLIRDFKAMSGHTPKSLPDYCMPYSIYSPVLRECPFSSITHKNYRVTLQPKKKDDARSKSCGDNPRLRFRNVDESPDANGDIL